VLDYLAVNGGKPKVSILFLITRRRGGVASRHREAAAMGAARRKKFDHWHSREPTNPKELGDMVKIGRAAA